MLLRANEQRNILHEIRKRKASYIGHILRINCLLKQVMEGKIKGEMEVIRRRGRRRRKLLVDLKDRRGYSHLNEEAIDRTMWRNRFRRGFGPVVRQNTEWVNEEETHSLKSIDSTANTRNAIATLSSLKSPHISFVYTSTSFFHLFFFLLSWTENFLRKFSAHFLFPYKSQAHGTI